MKRCVLEIAELLIGPICMRGNSHSETTTGRTTPARPAGGATLLPPATTPLACRTTLLLRAQRRSRRGGVGLGGPLMLTSGWVRRMFSPTAHDSADRSTSHLADTVGTDRPPACQWAIAARTSPTVRTTRRRRRADQRRGPGSPAVRHQRRRLPQVRRVEEPLEQLADRERRPGCGEVDPRDAVVVDQLAASPLGEVGVAVDGERPLHAAAPDGVEADHDPESPTPPASAGGLSRYRASPASCRCGIPITGGHPYSYRDSYRDAARPGPASRRVLAGHTSALGGNRTPNLLIRSGPRRPPAARLAHAQCRRRHPLPLERRQGRDRLIEWKHTEDYRGRELSADPAKLRPQRYVAAWRDPAVRSEPTSYRMTICSPSPSTSCSASNPPEERRRRRRPLTYDSADDPEHPGRADLLVGGEVETGLIGAYSKG